MRLLLFVCLTHTAVFSSRSVSTGAGVLLSWGRLRWLAGGRAPHQHVVPQGSLPWQTFLAAAAPGVTSKVAFGWSSSKSYYLLIGFVLALLCLITNCLSHIRSTMRCLSAVLWAFCVRDSLFACNGRFCFGESLNMGGRRQKLCISNAAAYPALQRMLVSPLPSRQWGA